MNQFNAIGRISKDLAMSKTGTGISVCRFSIAISRSYKKEGQPDADFLNVVTFKATADFCEKYFKKGTQIGITGSIQNNNWEKDGVKHYDTVVMADKVYFADSKKADEPQTAKGFVPEKQRTNNASNSDEGFLPIDESELPF